jgi:hypothetical protein
MAQPVQVHVQTNDDRGYQQSLLLEQQYKALEMIDQANASLDTKATQLLQGSGLIVALIGVLSFPSFATSHPTPLMKVGIAVAFFAFLMMVGLSILAWSPRDYHLPGSVDWDEMYKKYILVDGKSSFGQVLSDCARAIELSRVINIRKGKMVYWSAFLLIVQIGGLMILALLA